MASWQYVFLFPASNGVLRPSDAVDRLRNFEAEFDDVIRLCIPVDSKGHLLEVGEKIKLNPPFFRDLAGYLNQGKSLAIQLQSAILSVSCQFFITSTNPHISLGWPRRMLNEAPSHFQGLFWSSVTAFAKHSNAAYVIVVNDASDHFEDRFLEVDGLRVLDSATTHQYGIGIEEVWLQTSLGAQLPEGGEFYAPKQKGDGFIGYCVARPR